MLSDLPISSTATKKKRDSAPKESKLELAIEYVDEHVPCADKKCTNPDGNVDWLDCAGCKRWFHNICVGVDPKIVNEAFKYYCSSCEIKHLNKSKKHQESEKPKKSNRAKDSDESKMNKSFNTTPVRSNKISTNASDVPVSDKKISVTNPLKKQKSEADEINTIAKPIQKFPLSLTVPCRISFSHLSWELQNSLGRTMKEDIEKQSETNSELPSNLRKKSGGNQLCVEDESERKDSRSLMSSDESEAEDTTEIFHKSKQLSREQSTELPGEPSRIQLIEPPKEQMESATESSQHEQSTESSLEQTTENSTPAEHLTFTKIGPHWEFSDEKCTLEELFQNVKNVVPISPLKTPDHREIVKAKETKTQRNKTEEVTKNAEPFAVGPEWPFLAEDFILKRAPSEVMRNYRPLTVGPEWGFSEEEFNLDNSETFEKIRELNWGPIMESNAYEALRLGHAAHQINQNKIIPASSLKTLDQRRIENAKERKAKQIEEAKEREAKKIKEAKEREVKRTEERKANTSYLTDLLEIDYIPNNVSVKVNEEVKRRGPAKQSPFMKAVQERKRKMADANSVQSTKMRKIGE